MEYGTVTLGGAYDGGGASSVGQHDHVIRYSGRCAYSSRCVGCSCERKLPSGSGYVRKEGGRASAIFAAGTRVQSEVLRLPVAHDVNDRVQWSLSCGRFYVSSASDKHEK